MAMASRICSLVSQPRSPTSSRSIWPTSATGPPKPSRPSRRKYGTTSPMRPLGAAVEAVMWRAPPCSAFCDGGLVERRPYSLGELLGIVIRPEMNEEHPRLFIEHVAVDCRHLDAVCPQRADQRVDFIAGNQEIAGDCGLATAGRLKVDSVGHPGRTGRNECGPHLADRVAARHPELVDATVGLALHPHDRVERCRVEIDRRRRTGRGGRRRERRLAFGKPGTDGSRELHRIAVRADMHIVCRW